MSITVRERRSYRLDEKENHGLLNEQQRLALVMRHLPDPNADDGNPWARARSSPPRIGLRRFLRQQLHLLVFTLMHSVFSLCMRFRQAWHLVSYRVSSILFYHHRTPALIERDVKPLTKKPKHLSAILKMENAGRATDLERLINEASDLAVWTACAGIPLLSVYERTGILKGYMPQLHRAILQKFNTYYGVDYPALAVNAPHSEPISSPGTGLYAQRLNNAMSILLVSEEDGRDSIVDLTKTLADMCQKGKIAPADINIELLDAELSEGIMSEPDLLLIFTPYIELSGYPPWQIRLSEMFCMQDNSSVGYQVFLNGLRKFAGAEQRKGR
ncbi:hypothetical protein TD95_004864 [Thielaviopsis punctulata]|uniref:ditrans,polycis-polyprenyl diphosphate synthase [(2E,6E)-farnesyldiphosphate specific] n=1 Tax=Thielaviopsis punctulata TaxID=72032 RepID=A0A0F4ZLR9_9PEZI|nr:hypothetical protein TD95_004864 [Thielaviopsis punctulata]